MLIVPLDQIRPLSIRGVNYYPRDTPWNENGGMWQTPEHVWRDDMTRAATLHINTVRVFIEDLLPRDASGAFRQDALTRFDAFLRIAAESRIRAIVCGLQVGVEIAGEDARRLANRSLIEPHRDDARILMWDIVNEPSGRNTDEIYPAIRQTLEQLKAHNGGFDRNHLTTVGAHHSDTARLAEAGALPDVVQYHEYDNDNIAAEGTGRVQWNIAVTRTYAAGRPVFIGECGDSTDPDDGVTEDRHLQLLTYIVDACEREAISGLLPWTFFDFGPPVFTRRERRFGLCRTDYSLKPGGEYLRLIYRRWWKRDQLDPTFGFAKNARLWCEEGREEPQEGHENWAHHQTEDVVRGEIKAEVRRVVAALDKTFGERLNQAFGHMKNARLRIDEGMWEPHDGHVHWAAGQTREHVTEVLRDQSLWTASRV